MVTKSNQVLFSLFWGHLHNMMEDDVKDTVSLSCHELK